MNKKNYAILFSMIVNNNTLLNILLPNENKTLKEVLQQADSKTLESLKSSNVGDVIKNLFNNLTNETKSNETVLNILKNSSLFKDLGSFTKELEQLLKNIPNEPKFAQAKETLQSSLVNIKNLDENTLKEMVQKSGIFMESKIANVNNNTNLNKLNDILLQIKELIKNDTSPKAKELNTLLDKIITQNSSGKASPTLQQDIKQAISLLKEVVSNTQNPNTQKIVALTNQLENLNQNVKLADSKIQNNVLPQEQKAAINNEVKPLLNQIKSELLATKNPIFTPIIKQLESLIQSQDIFNKNQNMSEPKALMQHLVQSPKLAQASAEVPKVNSLLSTLANQLSQVETIESNVAKNQIEPKKIEQLQTQIKQTLTQLQTALSEVKNVDVKGLQPIIDKLISMPNLFSKMEIPLSMQQQLSQATTPQQTTAQNTTTQQTVNQAQTASQTVQTNSTVAHNKTDAINQKVQEATSSTINKNTPNVNSDTKSVQEPKTTLQANLTNSSSDTKGLQEAKPTLQVNLANSSKIESSNTQQQPNQIQQEIKPLLNNLSENIKSIITAIKTSLAQTAIQNQTENTAQNTMNQFEVQKSISKLETLFQTRFENLSQQLMQNAKSPQDLLQNDVKTALLQLQTEMANTPKMQELSQNIDKMINHVEYYQMLSITSNSNYLYLPFLWDMLEDGSISMKKLQEDRYFCEIHLTLKEFGNMDLLLGLYENNHLDISIFAQKEFVKDLIKEHMVELRVGLNKAGLIPENIKVLDLKTQEEKQEEPTQAYNHNPYNNDDLGFGVDIKV